VGGVKLGDHPMTPVLYTRGLQSNGRWSAASGVYRDTGGFIAFLGGSVGFYASTDPELHPPGVFVSNHPASASPKRPTDAREAIPLHGASAAGAARIYGIPPASGGGGMIGTPNGTPANRAP
jgi:hypothetical protein